MALEPETDEEFIARVARETGEDPRHVCDLLEAMKSMDEEIELVEKYEGPES